MFVVVLSLTHNIMQSVVAGQAPKTLEWKKYLVSKTEGKPKNKDTHSTSADTREAKRRRLITDKNLKKKLKRGKNKTKQKQKEIAKRKNGKTDHTNRYTKWYKRE